jgi:putative ABC transport system permease protein
MIRHYVKIALRNLAQQKVLTGINIFGLSAGIACFSLFLLYAVHEFSYDRFHHNANRIYRMVEWWKYAGKEPEGSGSMYTPLAPAMKKDFPDVEYAVRLKGMDCLVKAGNEAFKSSVTYADPSFFSVFTFPLLHGHSTTALQYPHNIVITRGKALQLFGATNVVGKTIDIKTDSAFEPFTISAVAQDVPGNSSIKFDILASFDHLANDPWVVRSSANWHMTIGMSTYVLLKPGSRLAQEPTRLNLFRKKYYPDEYTAQALKEAGSDHQPKVSFGLQPLRDVHMNAAVEGGMSKKNIWILISIAAGVLIIACINFTTLAIGRSAGRAKEVGVRKVMGSRRKQLVYQFLCESLLLTLFAAAIGIVLAYALLPLFNQLADTRLSFSLRRFPELGWMLAGLTLLVGLLAGSYPALVLSAFKPIEVLKSKVRVGGSNLFTQSLVTLQFVLSIGLIIATVIILQQVSYMHTKNIGFNKQNVVMIDTERTDAITWYPVFKQAVQAHPGIIQVTAAEIGLGSEEGQMGRMYKAFNGKESGVVEYPVDTNFLITMGMPLVAGRGFGESQGADTNNAVIVNEALVQSLFGTVPGEVIGKQIVSANEPQLTRTIIGVSRDFNFEDLTHKVRPQLFFWPSAFMHSRIFVRIAAGDPSNALQAMHNEWKKLAPNTPFEYSFVDEKFDNFYKAERRWSLIVGWAGGISVFLACLGLFGLAALAVVNRTKEIGIRKVLGASAIQIARLLTQHFVRLIVIALVIAAPIAWYFMNNWLQSYAYRIHIGWWVFAVAGIFAVFIAVATVSVQAIKAAVVNPVKSLRTE